MAKIRIGTRGSKLALWQANWVAAALGSHGHEVELIRIETSGDVSTASLRQVGGQGVFTKEIQRALLQNTVDVAVHSLKDLPTLTPDELTLAAVPQRESTHDCLISADSIGFDQLPPGARVGTGSSRRAAQLLAWRDDIVIADIRGNVDSRLRKLRDGQYDAIVLAAAGLKRLELDNQVCEFLPQDRVLPAIGQGALGLECRTDDHATIEALSPLSDGPSLACVLAERAALRGLDAGCLAPVAGMATVQHDRIHLQARVIAADGGTTIDARDAGELTSPEELGTKVARQLIERGAAELIASVRNS